MGSGHRLRAGVARPIIGFDTAVVVAAVLDPIPDVMTKPGNIAKHFERQSRIHES